MSDLFAATQIPDVDDSLDGIFRICNDMMVERKWNELSNVFESLDPTKMKPEIAVGVLTGGLPTRSSVGYRVFYNRTHKIFTTEFGAEKTEEILKGLEPEYK